eukprot:CAMPEP_0172589276 /NCGR_PEP_ID=MMETSP1068-20121228/8054_1 /TAXON_ID=35684 /ORGANISM="Pseudopedinella elastica, Strain CCMP716" /LENGTH=177 /DNA_ID=CAMNT_0013384837 /DNA_START=46 /DNA_END=576 /DNA_ORIENTATION=-
MGNPFSSDATIDGFPVAPLLRRAWANSLAGINSAASPFSGFLKIPSLSDRVALAAPLMKPPDRKELIEGLELDRHGLSNSISKFQASMDQLRMREEALTKELIEIETVRVFHEEALERLEGTSEETQAPVQIQRLRAELAEKIPDMEDRLNRGLIMMRAERERMEERLQGLAEKKCG